MIFMVHIITTLYFNLSHVPLYHKNFIEDQRHKRYDDLLWCCMVVLSKSGLFLNTEIKVNFLIVKLDNFGIPLFYSVFNSFTHMLHDELLKQTSNKIFNKKFDWELSVKCYHLTAKAHFVCTFINGSLWIYPLCNPHHHPQHFFWAITSADAKRS